MLGHLVRHSINWENTLRRMARSVGFYKLRTGDEVEIGLKQKKNKFYTILRLKEEDKIFKISLKLVNQCDLYL